MSAENSYFNSGPYRKNRAAVEERAEQVLENDLAKDRDFGQAFGTYRDSRHISAVEAQDFADLMRFIHKRIAAGAISSRAFRAEVAQGNLGKPLEAWAPSHSTGHDPVHSLFAYLGSGGKSLVPAYMRVENQGDEDADRLANLEEDYVTTFSSLDVMRKRFLEHMIREREQGTIDTDPVEEAIANFESRINLENEDPQFMDKHRIPEFEAILRNLYADLKIETPDPNFPFHEFMRVFAPVVERLRRRRARQAEGDDLTEIQ